MGPLLWAGLVAAGVAVASMAVFAARLTKARSAGPTPEEEFVPSTDPDDPWAAYRPRPFQEVERRRPRMWPAVAGVFGLVLVGGGMVGARQSAELTTVEALPTAKPSLVDVTLQSTPKPTPVVTPAPRVVPTQRPRPAVAPAPKSMTVAAKPSGAGPKITGSMSCSGGMLRLSAQVSGTKLKWFGMYVDGKVAKGGPISGTSYATTYTKAAEKGDHTGEVTAEDSSGATSRKILTARCN